jgi:hypothetical protein
LINLLLLTGLLRFLPLQQLLLKQLLVLGLLCLPMQQLLLKLLLLLCFLCLPLQ